MSLPGSTRRAVICSNSSWYLSNFRSETIRALLEDGWEVVALAPEAEFAAELEALGASFRQVRMSRRSLSPLSNVGSFFSFYRLYRELRPDLVHHFTIKPVILGGIAARLARVRAIVQAVTGLGTAFTGSRLLRYPALLGFRLALGGGALTIFQNPEDRSTLVEAGVVQPDRAILIRGSGVDLDRFAAPQRRERDQVTFVMACRMLWSKGVREFVESGDRVAAAHPEARFVLIGAADAESREGVPATWLEEATATRPHLDWLGFVGDIAPILREADVMVLPSYYGEGVPKSLLEGAAAGLPLVSTDMPGCREVVAHEKTGLVVAPRDVSALAGAMDRLLAEPSLRARCGAEARRMVERDFAVEAVVQRTMDCYRSLLPPALAARGGR